MERQHLVTYPLETVENFYRQGIIGQDDFEWYCCEWRNGAVRFSSLHQSYESNPCGQSDCSHADRGAA